MKIANKMIHGRVILAPMAEYTNLPFRLLCKEYGASLVFTEMAMAKAIVKRDRREIRLLRTKPQEKPIAAQICGHVVVDMIKAAQVVESMGFDMVDINMCCPIQRVLQQGAGGALLGEPRKIEEIVSAVVKATHLPVTVKLRSGVDENQINVLEISQRCEAAGVAAITLHPRTVLQGFVGEADWSLLAKLKGVVSIPVIGSGDIRTPAHVKKMIEATGCDGVMAARGCMGRPWFFRAANHLLNTGAILPEPSYEQIKQIMIRHFKLLESHDKSMSISLLRRHLPYYARAMKREEDFGRAVRKISTVQEFQEAVRQWL